MYAPSLYDPQYVGEFYQARSAEFVAEGAVSGYRPMAQDSRRVGLIIVDMQYDFVHPNCALPVAGAVDDLQRLVEWIYYNCGELSSIYASLDQHNYFQIFSPLWWEDPSTGEHPDPYTLITTDDVARGRWRALIDPVWSHNHYLPQLKANVRKDLMIWPLHCLMGTQGESLMPALTEAIAFHAAARKSQPVMLGKGSVPQVEHYGIFGAEVVYPKAPQSGLNTQVLDIISRNDLIYVSGEDKSHCVLETMRQLVTYFGQQPSVLRKIRFLTDCTSSVPHPTIDFDAMAEDELRNMARMGVQLVRSTDPIG